MVIGMRLAYWRARSISSFDVSSISRSQVIDVKSLASFRIAAAILDSSVQPLGGSSASDIGDG